jgi:hypothetical protein
MVQLATAKFIQDEMGRPIRPQVVVMADAATGQFSGAGTTVVLANNVVSLAAGANTTPQTVTTTASYGWSYIFGGTTPSLKLQALGADGSTWQDVATVTASGAQGIGVFAGGGGASVRLFNAGANPITGLTSSLSS